MDNADVNWEEAKKVVAEEKPECTKIMMKQKVFLWGGEKTKTTM